ncbi:hypothetical protein [[Clostridium] hylemonae]|uniref:hypothetical protein n=1 Tax=[Clostridium] hylemonae TaxID=89153 RepID=UPI001FCC5261|nr:hypothetical protein [[Clostridium] hylemonae]BDF03433.1 hypothetical protein CE91St63_04950 [[Clostridium] hylemonae]
MEKIKKAVGYISLAILILLLLYVKYAYERGAELWPAKTKLSKDEVRIERKIKIPEGETKEFILPVFLVDLYRFSTDPIEKSIEELEKGNEGNMLFEKVEENGDGTLTLTLTRKQLEYWISTGEEAINTRIENNKNKDMKIKINKDYTKVTYILKEGFEISFMEWGMDAQVILGSLLEAQVFTGVAPEDCYVREIIKRESDGKTIVDMNTDNRYFEVTDEEWYGEKTKDK